MGVAGTPSIVLEDGRMLPGYLPAAELAEALGLVVAGS
jgi:thiol:disulfide interchange protein DsbC